MYFELIASNYQSLEINMTSSHRSLMLSSWVYNCLSRVQFPVSAKKCFAFIRMLPENIIVILKFNTNLYAYHPFYYNYSLLLCLRYKWGCDTVYFTPKMLRPFCCWYHSLTSYYVFLVLCETSIYTTYALDIRCLLDVDTFQMH